MKCLRPSGSFCKIRFSDEMARRPDRRRLSAWGWIRAAASAAASVLSLDTVKIFTLLAILILSFPISKPFPPERTKRISAVFTG